MKTIEERAEQFWQSIRAKVYSSSEKIVDWGEECYVAGATEQKAIDIDKACEWFKKHYREYVLGGEDMIADFRKAMED